MMEKLEKTCWQVITSKNIPADAPAKAKAWETLRWVEKEKAQRKERIIHQQVEEAATMTWWQKIRA